LFWKETLQKFSKGVTSWVRHMLYNSRLWVSLKGYAPEGAVATWRHAALHQLGDVTIVRAKKRRTCGPQRVKSVVTNFLEASASAILNQYAMRWA
jgi:hypothetical protein